MSALGLYGSLLVICVAAAIIGQAVAALCGRRTWSWIAPAVGMAVLTVVGGLTIRLPGRGSTAAFCVAGLVILSLVVLWRLRPSDLSAALRAGAPVAIVVALAASLPFAAAGHLGELGVRVNNDLGIHLQNADWLRTHAGDEPVQVGQGYPVGPHGLVVAVAELTGANLREAFTGLLIAVQVLIAIASLAVFGGVAPVRRAIAALLVGLAYLSTSFYVQSAFKETLMGLFVVGFVLALRELAGEDRPAERMHTSTGGRLAATIRSSVPLALIVAAGVQTYSYPGVYWAMGTSALWAVGVFVAAGGLRAPGAVVRRLWPLLSPLAIGAAILIAITAPTLARITSFVQAQEGSFGGTFGQGAIGNLYGPIPPDEILGLWLSSDFRFAPPGDVAASALALLGVVALVVAIVRLVRRREFALLAGLATSGVIYLGTRDLSSTYVQSKALAIAAPLVMLCMLGGLLEPTGARRDATARSFGERARLLGLRLRDFIALAGPRELGELGRSVLAAAFALAALFSTYLALGGAAVGPELRSADLAELRPELEGTRVAFLAFGDNYSEYDLRRADSVVDAGSARTSLPRRFDFDSVSAATLRDSDLLIAAESPFSSEAPDGFRVVRSTDHFTLLERAGPTGPRHSLWEVQRTLTSVVPPGRVLDCETTKGRAVSRRRGVARVVPTPPIIGPTENWSASAPLPRVAGESVASTDPAVLNPGVIPIDYGLQPSQSLRLSRGRWVISLQYVSPDSLRVDAAGLSAELPPVVDAQGPFWEVGSLRVSEPGPVPFTVGVERPPLLRRILQGPDSLRTRPDTVIGAIAATRVEPRRTVPLSEACGEYVDWYRVE
jgi:hypothetical protein